MKMVIVSFFAALASLVGATEIPVKVTEQRLTVEENEYFRRERVSFSFVNENDKRMAHELEFPLPEGAIVTAYALEIDGTMVPGVVCPAAKARIAFENEVRRRVDPGLVERVKGNVWRTRIFPLLKGVPRKAELEYIVAKEQTKAEAAIYERDGDEVFIAEPQVPDGYKSVVERIGTFAKGYVLWDASLSRLGKTAADRERLMNLPEHGEWQLVVFANVPSSPRLFTSRAELLSAIDAAVYDGGTDLSAALATAGDELTLLFSDELDTLSMKPVTPEPSSRLILASRQDAPQRKVVVRKVGANEKMPRLAPRPSKLLATVWAVRRMEDFAAQADSRQDEFLALGRRYGVAGPGLSLIVLETLDQYLEHKIEPPKTMSFHDEWEKRCAAEDDQIADKKARAEHEKRLLEYWEERVKWWNDPKPKIETPKSGLFNRVMRRGGSSVDGMSAVHNERVFMNHASAMEETLSKSGADNISVDGASAAVPVAEMRRNEIVDAQVKLKPWDPKTPYLDELKQATAATAYSVYLQQREKYRESPAFYLDCAGYFFGLGERTTALKVISNLAEFKLEDAALWRTMGWRLREAGAYDEAVRAFRKVLAMRGEEGVSYRDLALVLTERGKAAKNKQDVEEALKLLVDTAFINHERRSTRRSNDFQVAVFALEELNGLLSWCKANELAVECPSFDAAYRRDLPVALRIVLSWDADQIDIDLHVLEPNGEEAYYGHRRTREGGFVSEDVTTGYGPEEYLKKDLERGVYKVLTNYFASHQLALTGATTVQATVYTDWGTAKEKMQILTLRLDQPKDHVMIGEIKL